MAESDALSYCPVTIVPESKLSHMATAHYGFVPNPSRHGGKTPRFALKNRCASRYDVDNNCDFGFSFLLLKAAGCFLFQQPRRQAGLHSRMHEWKTNGCNPSTTEKGFGGFC